MRSAFRRRGISYILSVVMMTLIITALSGAFLTWGVAQVSESRSQLTSAVRTRTDRVQERILVEDVFLKSAGPPPILRIFVRNTGAIQVVVDRVYVDHQQATITASSTVAATCTTATLSPGSTLSLAIQQVGCIDVTLPSGVTATTGTSILVRAATNRGTTHVATWVL